MKIAITCFNLSWQSGGPRLIFSVAQGLLRTGHTVIIYAPEFSGEYFKELWKGLDIRVVPPPAPLVWAGRPKGIVTRIMQKFSQEKLRMQTARVIADAMDDDFDVVNVHDQSYAVAYFYKARNPKAKVLWTENDPPYMYLPKKNKILDLSSKLFNWWKDISSKKYFRAIDTVAVLDFYNKRWAEARGMCPVIIRLGVDFESFYLPVKDIENSLKRREIRIFSLGSLNQYRRYEDILEAAQWLRDWGYYPSLRIIANDQWNEGVYREKLESFIRENRLESAVQMVFKGVSEEGLKQAYQEADVFVYPMYVPPPRDGFGFSIGVFEAMAAGLPVIMCRTTTSVEVLKDGINTLVVDPESAQQIAGRLKFLMDHPEKYEEIATAGQKLVKTTLTWERYVEATLALLEGGR